MTPSNTALPELHIQVGEARLRLPQGVVEAVVMTPPITPVPGAPPEIAGLFNHQGAIYTAVHPLAPGHGHHAVLVRNSTVGRFAILCDWVHDLAEDAQGGDILDVAALAARILSAYAAVDQQLPAPDSPRARLRLRRPQRGTRP